MTLQFHLYLNMDFLMPSHWSTVQIALPLNVPYSADSGHLIN